MEVKAAPLRVQRHRLLEEVAKLDSDILGAREAAQDCPADACAGGVEVREAGQVAAALRPLALPRADSCQQLQQPPLQQEL